MFNHTHTETTLISISENCFKISNMSYFFFCNVDNGCYDVVTQNQLELSSVPQNVPLTTTVYKVSNNPVLPDSDLR